ncbi:TonB-dependent receptor domain-containing protein [Aggregatibacter actinomycetemcomitans]|uniref:TonB-dependent receptor domain-containing protein n=1 Tax=Aggregatibacter actinomycetemcomitans TaxID=714 RepID=UPI0018D5D515|nr:TonB-dependent receptor [Aggregatibacter actinomycetemcomitans]QPQ80252.1 TonB-dependent receptor [Aggregatibacter actinomycetemcomitans]
MVTFCILNVLNVANAEEQLDQIDVVEKTIANEKKPFTEAKAKSTRENVFKSTETVDNVVRSIPGAFTQQDKSSGVLSLNIRGETGFGRANTMVDGVTQTFYSTSMDAGRAGGNSQFGAAIDPNFIAGIDLTKGNFSGTGGVNSLYGAANFRTLGVNDVIQGDKNYGFLTKGLTGDNETKYNYMAMGAARKWLDNGGYIGVLYGYSQREVSQNYKVGGGGERISDVGKGFLERKRNEFFRSHQLKFNSEKNEWERDFSIKNSAGKSTWEYPWNKKYNDPQKLKEYIAELGKIWNENEVPQWDLTPIDPSSLVQRSKSHLVKVEFSDDRHTLNLQYRTLDNHIGSRKIENQNYQLNYNFNNNGYLDLNVLLAHNVDKQKYPSGSRFGGWQVLKYLETKNTADIVDISNSYTFSLPKETDLKTTLGVNLFKNQYTKNRFPEELSPFYDGPSQKSGLYDFLGRFKGDKGILPQKSTILQPSGEQRFNTVYLDTSLTRDIFKLDYSVNFVKYKFNGEYTAYYNSPSDFKKAFGEDSEIYKKHCNPSCDLYEPVYKKGGKKSAVNHSVVLSAEPSDYFMPFISYARTHRMPNIQEMYFSQIGDSGVNTNLKPERADTYQIGFNTFKNNVFLDDDVLGLKAVFYRSRIKDYIHNVYGKWWNTQAGLPPSWVTTTGLSYTIQHRNYQKRVNKRGLELELNYDAGRFFTNLSYAYQKTNQPTNYSDASESPNNASKQDQIKQGYGLTKISMLPRDYGRLEIGSRWFDRKLTIGSAVRYYGKSKRATTEERYIDGTKPGNTADPHNIGKRVIKETETIDKQPLVVDFYVAYEPVENLVIRADIQNAFDKRYIDPLDAANDAATQRYFSTFENLNSYGDDIVQCDSNGLCNGRYGGKTNSILNNYARGRTFVLSVSYKF